MPRIPQYKDRRKAQAGTTLVELLVSLVIMGMALVLIIGAFSTGLLDSTLAKRNTAAEAVIQYEMDKVSAAPFAAPASYADCFATENTNPPSAAPCVPGSSTLEADVAGTSRTSSTQTWTVTVFTVPDHAQVGTPVSLIKVNR